MIEELEKQKTGEGRQVGGVMLGFVSSVLSFVTFRFIKLGLSAKSQPKGQEVDNEIVEVGLEEEEGREERARKLFTKLQNTFCRPEISMCHSTDIRLAEEERCIPTFSKKYGCYIKQLCREYWRGTPPGYECLSDDQIKELSLAMNSKHGLPVIGFISKNFRTEGDQEDFEKMEDSYNVFRFEVIEHTKARLHKLKEFYSSNQKFPENIGVLAEYDCELPKGRHVEKVEEQQEYLDLDTFSVKMASDYKRFSEACVLVKKCTELCEKVKNLEKEAKDLQDSVQDVDLSREELSEKYLNCILDLSSECFRLRVKLKELFHEENDFEPFASRLKICNDLIDEVKDKVKDKIWNKRETDEDKAVKEWTKRHVGEKEITEAEITNILTAERKVLSCMSKIARGFYYFGNYLRGNCKSDCYLFCFMFLKELSDDEAIELLKSVINDVYKIGIQCNAEESVDVYFPNQVLGIKLVEALLEYNAAVGIDDSEVRKYIRIFTGEPFEKLLYYTECEEEYADQRVRPFNSIMTREARCEQEDRTVNPHLLQEVLPAGCTVRDYSKMSEKQLGVSESEGIFSRLFGMGE